MREMTQALANQGRYGDSVLVHMNPAEVEGMGILSGQPLTINPTTGAYEAFNWGQTLGGIAGGAIAGPWGAGIGAGLGSKFVDGQSWGDALTAGLTSGIMSWAGSSFAGSEMGQSFLPDFMTSTGAGALPAGVSPAGEAVGFNFVEPGLSEMFSSGIAGANVPAALGAGAAGLFSTAGQVANNPLPTGAFGQTDPRFQNDQQPNIRKRSTPAELAAQRAQNPGTSELSYFAPNARLAGNFDDNVNTYGAAQGGTVQGFSDGGQIRGFANANIGPNPDAWDDLSGKDVGTAIVGKAVNSFVPGATSMYGISDTYGKGGTPSYADWAGLVGSGVSAIPGAPMGVGALFTAAGTAADVYGKDADISQSQYANFAGGKQNVDEIGYLAALTNNLSPFGLFGTSVDDQYDNFLAEAGSMNAAENEEEDQPGSGMGKGTIASLFTAARAAEAQDPTPDAKQVGPSLTELANMFNPIAPAPPTPEVTSAPVSPHAANPNNFSQTGLGGYAPSGTGGVGGFHAAGPAPFAGEDATQNSTQMGPDGTFQSAAVTEVGPGSWTATPTEEEENTEDDRGGANVAGTGGAFNTGAIADAIDEARGLEAAGVADVADVANTAADISDAGFEGFDDMGFDGDYSEFGGMGEAGEYGSYGMDDKSGFDDGWAQGGLIQSHADGGTIEQGSDPILLGAVAAIKGQHPEPQAAIQQFVQVYGPEKFAALRQRVIADASADQRQQSGIAGLVKGPGDGLSDDVPANIEGREPVNLADGEVIIPADVVSGLGNGSTDAGAEILAAMNDRIRKDRTGTKNQPGPVDVAKAMPRGMAEGGLVNSKFDTYLDPNDPGMTSSPDVNPAKSAAMAGVGGARQIAGRGGSGGVGSAPGGGGRNTLPSYHPAGDISRMQHSANRRGEWPDSQEGFDDAMRSSLISESAAYLYDPRFQKYHANSPKNQWHGTATSMLGNIEDSGTGYLESDWRRNSPGFNNTDDPEALASGGIIRAR